MNQHEASYTYGTGQYHRLTGDFNFVTGENAALRLNAMVHDADNHGAARKTGPGAHVFLGCSTRDEFSVGLYYLNVEGRPLTNHPGCWAKTGKFFPPCQRKLLRSGQRLPQHHHAVPHPWATPTALTMAASCKPDCAQAATNATCWPAPLVFMQPRPTSLDQITDSTVLTRGSKGRVARSDITQIQSDYSNAFTLGGQQHKVIAGIDYTDEDADRNNSYANTTPRPNTTVGTPDDGAWVADGRAPAAFNTFKARNLGLYVRKTPWPDGSVKLVGGLRYDNFKASYRNADGRSATNAPTACGSHGWA